MTPRSIDCPICGRELGIAAHMAGSQYTQPQRWLINKLHGVGLPVKLIGRVVGSSGEAVRHVLYPRIRWKE